MKEITKYQADDGTVFTLEQDCREYEQLCADVARVMAPMPPKPDLPSCRFENGGGYIQHDKDVALTARRGLLELANKIMPHKWFEQSLADDTTHASWAGRMIDEMSRPCLYRAWHRFMCMTPDFREYGQPYYASHPGQAENVRLN